MQVSDGQRRVPNEIPSFFVQHGGWAGKVTAVAASRARQTREHVAMGNTCNPARLTWGRAFFSLPFLMTRVS